MGKPKAPPPPNYAKLAEAQGQANLDAAIFNTNANRVNQVGPDGSITWEMAPGTDPRNPGVGAYTQRTTLSPAQQGLYDSGNRISQSFLDTAESGLGRVGDAMASKFDTSQLPAISTGDAAYTQQIAEALMGRMEPQFQRDEQELRTQLLNSGIEQGSEAYNREMDRLDRAKTDARMQALLSAGSEGRAQAGFGNQARQQGIQEQSFLRQLPLNEINALRTGSQVSMPQFGSYYTGGNTQAAPVFDAGMAQGNYNMQGYQNKLSGYNALLGGLAGMGGAWLGRP
jgi:hypothetical protein